MPNKPIDPLRMRIFSELNIQLAQHGIDKEIMNEASKNLAFLARYYLNTPDPNPLQISIPIVTLPMQGSSGEMQFVHKIALVVQNGSASAGSGTPASSPSNAATHLSVATEPRVRVLVQMIGHLGHWQCLIGDFASAAERVVRELLDGDEEFVNACEEGRKKAKACKKHSSVEPVWDVHGWDDDC